jgi:hypothetical protein
MTTATMTFGMLPLALKLEPGAESRAPMAVVVIGGLLTSTFLAIFVTPSLYTLLDDLQSVFFKPATHAAPIPAQRLAAPKPVPAAVAAGPIAASTTRAHTGTGHTNGSNGHNGEPRWLQKLRTGEFDDD